VLIQVPFLIKHKFGFRFRFNLRDPALAQIAALALPVAAATWVGPVNLLVNGKAVNVFGGRYDYNAIQYANNLYTVASGVFVLAVANVVFPLFAKQAAADDDAAFTRTLGGTLRGLLFFLVPLTAGFMALASPIVRLIHEGGLFGAEALAVTSRALFWFSPGIIGYGLQIVLSRACYALRDGRTPAIAAVIAIAINAAASFTLTPALGVAGPAIASSVSISAAAAYILARLARGGYLRITRGAVLTVCKIAALSLVMLAAVLPCREFFAAAPGGSVLMRFAAALVPAAIGAGVYFAGAFLLKMKMPFAKEKR
jgi:putative peptidoglycan lipid II flippase